MGFVMAAIASTVGVNFDESTTAQLQCQRQHEKHQSYCQVALENW